MACLRSNYLYIAIILVCESQSCCQRSMTALRNYVRANEFAQKIGNASWFGCITCPLQKNQMYLLSTVCDSVSYVNLLSIRNIFDQPKLESIDFWRLKCTSFVTSTSRTKRIKSIHRQSKQPIHWIRREAYSSSSSTCNLCRCERAIFFLLIFFCSYLFSLLFICFENCWTASSATI